ncbi:unnamed protein product [Callosobruchus maculatus]|uniref:Uncharacterized protein n=1 Tax=Callosobruchus maculatus TaxID=64391 RepID=A0A653CRU8_CALMS|nr:unnamed protein product [Callosobruchus maculatus]
MWLIIAQTTFIWIILYRRRTGYKSGSSMRMGRLCCVSGSPTMRILTNEGRSMSMFS